MSYPNILKLIDADLDRLYQARQIITSPHFSPEPVTPPEQQSADEVSLPAEQAAEIPLAPAERVPTILKPRRTRVAGVRPRKTAQSDGALQQARALGGAVPALPVYVAATQLRQEQARRDAAPGFRPQDAPLTAEALAQRWLQSMSS